MSQILQRLAVFLAAVFVAPDTGADGDVEQGRRIAQQHCARCHVVSDANKYGGIDSTPSFALLARMPDALERVQTFYLRRPHPVFVEVPGNPRPHNVPPTARPFRITVDDVDHLIAYVRSLQKR